MLRALCLLLCLLAVAGDADARDATPRDAAVEAAMALPDELRRMLPADATNRRIDDAIRTQALVDFMIADDGLALRYQEQPTYGIAESFARRRVNCLSFTMLFVAMARAVGIPAYAQASEDALAMRMQDGTLFRATHVNAGVLIDGARHSVDVGWRGVAAGRDPRRISDARMVALLHNNHAVEHLLQGEHAAATDAIEAALALNASSATIWSNAGVVHARSGRRGDAERAYLRAVALQRNHIGALSNLVGFFRSGGDPARAAIYEQRLQRAQALDPFSQFLIGQSRAEAGVPADAIVHYRRAIRMLPQEPQFHRSLAEAYQALGDLAEAERARERASLLERRQEARQGIREADDPGPG
ncbi:MAG TPA: transglutaminase domain-containing protein [Thermomonas sp.]|nr:transglutaminase domain-containing protein [Thermomonas sp.]